MEQEFIENSVRTRLILAGMSEIEKHGVNDFSLRRVALAAQVSCAAPYRHFKDKDEYIREIISYVNSKWELLSREIERIYGDSFLDITDLNQLPMKLTGVVKRHIRV